MISKLDENSTELDLLAAKAVPGTMYVAGADTVSEAPSDGGVYVIYFWSSLIDCHCPGDIHPRNDIVP
jgi:hypothetical protein